MDNILYTFTAISIRMHPLSVEKDFKISSLFSSSIREWYISTKRSSGLHVSPSAYMNSQLSLEKTVKSEDYSNLGAINNQSFTTSPFFFDVVN